MPDEIKDIGTLASFAGNEAASNSFMPPLEIGDLINGRQTPQSLFSNVQKTGSFYHDYIIRTLRKTDYGIKVMPIAATTGAARPVRVHAPFMRKFIIWEVERFGSVAERPTLPHWNTGDPNDVLINSLIMDTSPVIQPGGKSLYWHVAGLYEYLCYAAMIDGDISQVAALPIANLTIQQLNAQGYTFDMNILAAYTQNQNGSPVSGYSSTDAKVISGQNQGYPVTSGLNAQVVG